MHWTYHCPYDTIQFFNLIGAIISFISFWINLKFTYWDDSILFYVIYLLYNLRIIFCVYGFTGGYQVYFSYAHVYPKVVEFFVNIYFALIQNNFTYVKIYVNYYLVTVVIDFLATVYFSVMLYLFVSAIVWKDPNRPAILFTLRILLIGLIIIVNTMQVFETLDDFSLFSCCI